VRKVIEMPIRSKTAVATAIALSLGLGLSACDTPNNMSLYSVKQPVVERNNYTIDVATGASGLGIPEQKRLNDWFQSMDLGYGDRVALDSSTAGGAAREDIAAIASRFGVLLSDGAPATEGFVQPGTIRVVVTRSRAHVPGCPDWSDQYGATLDNATTDGFGCAINTNLAAMVADPEHLLHGAEGTGETVVMSSTKAIESYREAKPTGAGGLPQVSSKGE
jgi:pilus assembly protein CpaD